MIDLQAVKDRLSLEDVFVHLGLDYPPKNRREFKILCPVHQEKTPSCSIWPSEQRWWCFGCGEGGDIFDLIAAVKHVDFATAAKELAELASVEASARPFEERQRSAGQLWEDVSYIAHMDIVKLAPGQPDHPCWAEYDEIDRMYRADEVSANEATRQILKWRLKWKEKLS
jgi:DNA primase